MQEKDKASGRKTLDTHLISRFGGRYVPADLEAQARRSAAYYGATDLIDGLAAVQGAFEDIGNAFGIKENKISREYVIVGASNEATLDAVETAVSEYFAAKGYRRVGSWQNFRKGPQSAVITTTPTPKYAAERNDILVTETYYVTQQSVDEDDAQTTGVH